MENKKGNMYWIPITMASMLAFGIYLGNVLSPTKEAFQSKGEQHYQKIQDIIHILDKKYVDSLDVENLFESTIGDMLHKLDPHSNYIPAKDLLSMNEMIEGKFGGVGVRFFIIRDTLCITNVLPYSPALRAGLLAGDKILEIDGEIVTRQKITNEEVMDKLKGKEGSSVKVKLLRNGKKFTKTIIRGSIPVESVVASYMIDDKIGYLKIEQFSMSTAIEFRQATEKLKQQGLKKLILDVRSNGGGILTGATQIVDEFLDGNIAIVETKGVHSLPYTYKSTSKGILKEVALLILINSNSASASEILAGAIQDNDRGTIMGRRSFGKGLVQEDVLLKDGSNLRLTIARYYTPTGRCIQKPYSDDIANYYEDRMERIDNGELYEIDSSIFKNAPKYTTPKGKIVYGGGGIMPDIFVPYDTTGMSLYYSELRYSTAFNTFAFDFVQGKRKNWNSIHEFNAKFKVTDEILKQFVAFASNELRIPKNSKDFNISKKLIAETLKAEIARQIWVEQGYYMINNTYDKEVQKAIKYLR